MKFYLKVQLLGSQNILSTSGTFSGKGNCINLIDYIHLITTVFDNRKIKTKH